MVEQVIPDAGKLVELAGRCEAASGPDRDIDGWIYCAMNPDEVTVVDHLPGRFPRKAIMGSASIVMERIGGFDGAQYLCAPEYTTSLDAAMTLVPEGWTYLNIEICARDLPGQHARVSLERLVGDDDQREHGYAKKVALALCAAALRARAASSDTAKSEGEV